jgi:tRNA(Ile)-lysidine synthase
VDSTTPSVDQPANASRLRAALGAVSRDPAAREIVRHWRQLSAGRSTLLACSGGADSAALVLAMAALAPAEALVVGHAVHDMRPIEDTHADRDFVRDLACSLGLVFAERHLAVPTRGNAEAGARRLRYAALTDMARAHSIGFVATAHHAEDQLETMVLALLRGAGPKGLSGMRRKRRLAEDVLLVRPMLGVSRNDAERICSIAGVEWRTDATNTDLSRARAAIRHRVLPALEDIRPGAAGRAAHTAELLHGAAQVITDRAETVFGDGDEWPREALRAERSIVVGEGLRRAFERASGGARKDRLPRRVVEQAVVFIRSNSGETKSFHWPAGVRIEADARTVRITSPC